MMTPVFNHLLCCNFVCCAKKVSKLINHPVVSLLDTRVSGTSTEMIAQCVYPKLPTTTNHKRLLRHHWDLSDHGGGEKRLPETSRPGLISTVSPDLSQTTHRFEEENTFGVILFLRLKDSHLHP
jgi:hypothetical protein